MGSGAESHAELAAPLGRMLAEQGYDLLTGGAGGVMEAVSGAFAAVKNRAGRVIGVIRAQGMQHLGSGPRRYAPHPPNCFVELPIFTHLPFSGEQGKDALSRNHINVLTSDAVVVLPGASGTLSELELAVEYGWPVIAFLGEKRVGGLAAADLPARYGERLYVAGAIDAVQRQLAAWLV